MRHAREETLTDATLWTLAKGTNRARAVSSAVPGVGVELRFLWNDGVTEVSGLQTGRTPCPAAFRRWSRIRWGVVHEPSSQAGIVTVSPPAGTRSFVEAFIEQLGNLCG